MPPPAVIHLPNGRTIATQTENISTGGAQFAIPRPEGIEPGDMIEVDAHFRDSLWDQDHAELAVHEYTVAATLEAESHVLRSIETVVRVLPFPECPWAAPHASTLVGMPVDSFRTSVQDTLTELQCCTHLNDMLRGLAEVPTLATHLD